MVPQQEPDNPLLRQASCVVGLTLSGHALIELMDRYGQEPIEEWAWWVGLEGVGGALTLKECYDTWLSDRQSIPLTYFCGVDLHPFPYTSHDEETIRPFTERWICDAQGWADFPVCDCVPALRLPDSITTLPPDPHTLSVN